MRPEPGWLDTALLSAFAMVAETNSFGQAAEQLGRSQSAISMQLKRLEERLGRRLFLRNAHTVELTHDGQVFLPYARRILELSDAAQCSLHTPELSGPVRVGIAEWFANPDISAVLARFADAHPDIRLTVTTDSSVDLTKAVASQSLDLALSIVEPGTQEPETIYTEALYWATGRATTLPSEGPMPMALSIQRCPYRKLATDKLKAAGIEWREALTSANLPTIRQALTAGLAVAMLPQSGLTPELRTLGPRDGFPPLPLARLGLYWAPGSPSAAARHLAVEMEAGLRRASAPPMADAADATTFLRAS